MYACTYVCGRECTRVRMCGRECTRVRMCVGANVRMCVCANVRVYVCAWARMYACTYVCGRECTRVRMCVCANVRVYVCSWARANALQLLYKPVFILNFGFVCHYNKRTRIYQKIVTFVEFAGMSFALPLVPCPISHYF